MKQGVIMHNKDEICETIVSLYPDIGVCGVDIEVQFDEPKHAWAVQLHKDEHHLTHYLEIPDADACIDGKQCVSLGLEIAQLRRNVAGMGF